MPDALRLSALWVPSFVTLAYQPALDVLERADRSRSTARAGRIDYARGEAHAGLGDRRQAEAHYLTAYRADPHYFWAAADLALLYASADTSAADRRRRAEPYVAR